MQGKLLLTRICGALLLASTMQVWAHGDVTPQPIDITGLEPIKDSDTTWVDTNPYSSNERAIEIGKHAFAQNCARCHGIDAISGGIAPDLREKLPLGQEGDEIFKERMINGAIRNGVTYMPKFDGIVKQEGLWAIRTWLETVSVDAPVKAAPAAAAAASAPSTNTPASTVARTGEEVFNTVCTACHTAGILNAPKIDDKAAWEPRAAKGLQGLLAASINGLNQMPAKGGNPSLTEQELSDAITYMLGKAGIDLAKVSSAAVATVPATTEPAKPATN
ncbi:MAG: cytochrome c-550 PedF [Thiolinea sp.]